MTESEARDNILIILNNINMPSNWKATLDLSDKNQIRLSFYKNDQFILNLFKIKLLIWESEILIREIIMSTYNDLLNYINTNPSLLETYVEIKRNVAS